MFEINSTWPEMLCSGELELGAHDRNQWAGQVDKDGSASLPVELTEDVEDAEGRIQVDANQPVRLNVIESQWRECWFRESYFVLLEPNLYTTGCFSATQI